MIRTTTSLTYLCLLILLLITFCTLSFPVYAGLPDLTVDSIWLERVSAPGVPVAGTDLALNESFDIVASIKNLGQVAANGYYMDVYYDSDYGRGGPDNITAGEVQEWYVGPLTATAGTHTTKWVVDPDNQIAELDESNNEKDFTFTIGGETTTTTATTNSTSSSAPATMTVQTTQVVTTTGTTTVTGYTTMTVISYTGTQISTSTIVVPAAATTGPSLATSTGQTIQVLTATGTTTVTGYRTMTFTSYTGTQTLTSTIMVPATGTTGPPALTSTGQTTKVLTSTRTTTVTSYTTTTLTSYTGTRTMTSTNVVTRPAAASTHLTYLGFLSLFAVTVGQMATVGSKGWRIRKRASNLKISTVSTLRSLSLHFVDSRDMILSRLMSPIRRRYLGGWRR
ncbi:MAG: CARDB domain-containing protein [Candidatus Bathyarchaeia archaeon]|jgi:hypothetical protein